MTHRTLLQFLDELMVLNIDFFSLIKVENQMVWQPLKGMF